MANWDSFKNLKIDKEYKNLTKDKNDKKFKKFNKFLGFVTGFTTGNIGKIEVNNGDEANKLVDNHWKYHENDSAFKKGNTAKVLKNILDVVKTHNTQNTITCTLDTSKKSASITVKGKTPVTIDTDSSLLYIISKHTDKWKDFIERIEKLRDMPVVVNKVKASATNKANPFNKVKASATNKANPFNKVKASATNKANSKASANDDDVEIVGE